MHQPVFIIGAAISDLMAFPHSPLEAGESIPGRVLRAPGGVGRNIAENLARLGLHPELVSVFGDDPFSRGLASHARRAGIGLDYSFQREKGEGCWHLAIYGQDNDLHHGVADLSAMHELTPAILAERLPALQAASAIVVETNCTEEALNWIATQAWAAPLYLDPISAVLCQKVTGRLGHYHTLKANRKQAEALTGQILRTRADLERVARSLLIAGLQRVFITLGPEGVFAADREAMHLLPAAKGPVASTTGAGDAFMAGLIWAGRRNWPVEDCARAGLAAAALALREEGAVSSALNEQALLEQLRGLC